MKLVIIGCDQLGAELAQRMSQHGNEVSVVDRDQSTFIKLQPEFNGRVHAGDALNEDVLLRAGINEADVLLALTRSDTTNYVLGLAAREIYKVPRVIVRNYDPACQVICAHMGLQAVSSAIWGAEQLEEMICQDKVEPVMAMGGGEIEVYAIRIHKEWAGQSMKELMTDEGKQVFIALTRSGISSIPDGDVIFNEDDLIHIAADHRGIESLRDRLNERSEGGV